LIRGSVIGKEITQGATPGRWQRFFPELAFFSGFLTWGLPGIFPDDAPLDEISSGYTLKSVFK
jgi:hypothetical protein